MHEKGDQSSTSKQFGQEESWAIVVFGADSHGRINDEVPPADKRSEVVEGVVGVHSVGKDDREQVETNKDHDNSLKAEVGFFVVYESSRKTRNMVKGAYRKRNDHLCDHVRTCNRQNDMLLTSSHEKIGGNQDPDRVVNPRNFGSSEEMIDQDCNCQSSDFAKRIYNYPLCIHPFHSSVMSLFKKPRSFPLFLMVRSPATKAAKVIAPKMTAS